MRVTGLLMAVLSMALAPAHWAQSHDMPDDPGAQGTVYSYVEDGVRHYSTQPCSGRESCRAIDYGPPTGWSYVTSDQYGHWYLNNASIRRDGNRVTFWGMTSFKNVQPASGQSGTFLSDKHRVSVDCIVRVLSFHQREFYSFGWGRGDNLGSWKPLSPQSQFAVPDTTGDLFVTRVCANRGA